MAKNTGDANSYFIQCLEKPAEFRQPEVSLNRLKLKNSVVTKLLISITL